MAVFPEQLERLNLNDPTGSLQQIENYIRYMTERMEFANSNTTRVVTEAGISSVGIYKTIITVADSVSVIQANMNNVVNSVTALSQAVKETQDNLATLTEAVTALAERVEKLEGGTEV